MTDRVAPADEGVMQRRQLGVLALALGLFETGCTLPPGDIGDLPSDGTAGTTDDATTSGTADGTSGDAGDSSTGDPISACGPDGPTCAEDQDGDCVGIGEDNAPGVPNPDQSDHDGDGLGDPIDACPLVASQGDSDSDGLGNACDVCRRNATDYNIDDASPPGYMRVRNIGSTMDSDGDGIGDVCDNCVLVPNCEAYDQANPWQPGDPIADGDGTLCQQDADLDMVGDACAGQQLPGAAGVVGMGADDDFDQDGLRNVVDACPRQPLPAAIACVNDNGCPDGRRCETIDGVCDHLDADADGVGDICDTCPVAENPLQVADSAMQEADDLDGDSVGNACETHSDCGSRADPTPLGFYAVSAQGWCCTTSYPGDGNLLDPDLLPITPDCTAQQEQQGTCRRLPVSVALRPGVLSPPSGCAQALADAGLTVESNTPLTPADVGSVDALWDFACRLPQQDQDFDGLGDVCDLCPLAFDPENLPFIDAEGTVWPNDGRFCNGEYALGQACIP